MKSACQKDAVNNTGSFNEKHCLGRKLNFKIWVNKKLEIIDASKRWETILKLLRSFMVSSGFEVFSGPRMAIELSRKRIL